MDHIGQLNEQQISVKIRDLGYSFIHAFKRFVENKTTFSLKRESRYTNSKTTINSIKDPVISDIPERFKGIVALFKEKINKVKGEELSNLFNVNWENLKIRGLAYQLPEEIVGEEKYDASYDCDENEIFVRVGKKYNPNAFLEQLMLVAGTNRRHYNGDKPEAKTGFVQNEYKNKYGISLTNGYAKLLCYRYFRQFGYKPTHREPPFVCDLSIYSVLTNGREINYINDRSVPVDLEFAIAGMIEQIVGREKMEAMFFNADARNNNLDPHFDYVSSSLISELSKYDDTTSIRIFLEQLDAYSKGQTMDAFELLTKVYEWFFRNQLMNGVKINYSPYSNSERSIYEFNNKIPNQYPHYDERTGLIFPYTLKEDIKCRAINRWEMFGEKRAMGNSAPGFPKAYDSDQSGYYR